jgi:light-regulated signal transduction histidine kinase (bacteriophytochrome)
LRAPLIKLIGFADLLEAKCSAQLDPNGAKYLAKIHEAAFKMSHLIDDMLRLAKVGRQGLHKKEVSLRSLVDEVLAELGTEIEKRKIDWRITALPAIDCDRGLMKQVLANLISNAVKYTGTREKGLIEIGQMTIEGQTAFFVRDNGVGFDMKLASRLFAPFQRLHQDHEFEGTGIGLATVQRIIEKHRGRIWAESEPGRGSTFFFTINAESAALVANKEDGAVLV